MLTPSSGAEPDRRRSPSLVLGAGATIETSLLPYKLSSLIAHYDIDVHVALSPRALQFVTPLSLEAITGHSVYLSADQLDAATHRPLHVVLSELDLLIVYPATPRIIVETALGSITCPVTRLAAFTQPERVVLCPLLSPRLRRETYEPHVRELQSRGVTVTGADSQVTVWQEVEFVVERMLGAQRKTSPQIVSIDRGHVRR